jgi:sulfite exporter TauE/SafE
MDYWTAFALGLAGSLHCAGMCGPLALAMPTAGRNVASFFLGRTAYNLGRITTYCLLGLLFGSLGRTLFFAGAQRWLSIGLGAALLAALLTSKRLALSKPISTLVMRLRGGMSSFLRKRSLTSLATLGLLNGLLPCGLVYVTAAGATATGSISAGALYMALFGLGTLPMMLLIGLSGRLVPSSLRLKLGRVVPVSVFLLATLLIFRGLGLGIPYLSPNLAAGLCCHHH